MNTRHDRRHAMAFRATVLCLSALIALTACSSTGGKPRETGGGMVAGHADTPRFTVAMVTHGPPGDTFWDLIRKGAETAAAKDNIELKYSAELQGPEQANLVQNAVDSKVDGIAVTLAKPDALASSVKIAIDAGIPVVALNAGIDAWKPLGVRAYFGQDEKISGEAAGKRLAADGAKKVVCIIQDQGNVALEARCAGVALGLGGQVENLNVNGTDMPSVQSTITAKLQQDPSVDYIMALGAPIALTAVQAKAAAGSNARIATFDTNAALVDAVKSDQVQWWLYLNNGNTIGGGQATLTGPAFIDKSNIDSIAQYAKNGTR